MGILEIMLCRIFMFMWSFGSLDALLKHGLAAC